MELFVYQWFCDGTQEVRAYCVDSDSVTVCVRVTGFRPGFYAEDVSVLKAKSLLRDFSPNAEQRTRNHLYSTRGRDVPFVWLDFRNWFDARKAADVLVKAGVKCHQCRAQPVLQLTTARELPTCGWIKVSPAVLVKREKYSKCKREYLADWKTVSPGRDLPQPPITWVALDLEVNSEVENAMPKDRPGDEIFMAGVIIMRPGKAPLRVLLSQEATDYPEQADGFAVQQYADEKSLLLGVCRMLSSVKPQVICGYNVLGFDVDYMLKRCVRLGIEEPLCLAGMAAEKPARERTIAWSSSAFGAQKYSYMDWEGVVVVDLMPIVKRDYKFDSYRLDFVAETLLGSNKDPITPADIFRAFATKEMFEVGKYCIQDVQLCVDLMEKLQVWVGLTEMAQVCRVNAFTLFTQGQQIRIYSQVYTFCEKNGYVVTDPADGKRTAWLKDDGVDQDGPEEDYVGAHVVEPEPGLYDNVVPLDFSSLYPSIMIAKNVCYSTRVEPGTPGSETFEWEDHLNCCHDPRKIEYEKITKDLWELEAEARELRRERDSISRKRAQERQLVVDSLNTVMAAQKMLRNTRADLKNQLGTKTVCASRLLAFYNSETLKGVMPTILTNLLDSRKRAKAAKAAATDKITAITMDKRQLAYKVSANSMYGAMGVKRGYLPFQEGAMTVTYLGRQCIETAAHIIGTEHGGQLVYGDTDSNYVTFSDAKTPAELWDKAESVGKMVSKAFPDPISLEFEKVIYTKFLILGKKRYIYLSCDRDGKSSGQMGYRGVLMARRDNSGLARKAYRATAQALLEGRDPWDELNGILAQIYTNSCSLKDFVITKQVGSWCREYAFVQQSEEGVNVVGDYKVRDMEKAKKEAKEAAKGSKDGYMAALYKLIMAQMPGHVQLANRMVNRGETVADGTRLEYVVLRPCYDGKKCRYKNQGLSDRLETVNYYKRFSQYLQLDVDHYVKVLVNPLDQLLETAGRGKDQFKAVYGYRANYRKVVEDIKTLRACPDLVKVTLK
ncbi:DNA polymerase [Largemouth bass virus]|uniref:DNA-directed DNA polymerase n=1 Tax=Largemouth bass virus TaxID=176656 RepID=A0A9E7TLM0_9VIRU|nr:putative DNA polymerase [Mandarin fish ranavirus]UUY86242.1 DNA polymerase [Largemouth bass virus]WEI28987.1 DNA polymerase [Largemouth bass virus]WHA35554.1 putative DNA polymerase [Micropterus salmoides ranavirus]WHA35659.1 putative DNA polymerase [Siniperca chuatsi ranavirus]